MATKGKGAAAPEGFLWGRDASSLWHVLREAELVDGNGDHRRHVRSACGAWHGVSPWTRGRWAEITRWLPPEPRTCGACLRSVAQAERAIRQAAQAPAPAQGRLF